MNVSQRRKLTPEQHQWVREIAARRAELRRQLALVPTLRAAASQLGVSISCLKQLLRNRTYRAGE